MIEIIIILLVVIALGVRKLVRTSEPQKVYVPGRAYKPLNETQKKVAVVFCILVIIALIAFAFSY